jgi:hypothetical protein
MKKYFIYLLLCLSSISYAQDQLFKKDNTKVDVKILEINQNEIKYKLFTYQDGPTITISKKDIALIIYQNGVHEVPNPTIEAAPVPIEAPYVIYNSYPTSSRVNRDSIEKAAFNDLVSNKNLISFNIIEPLNGSLSVNYLREFANNYLNIYVPVSVGFANPYFTQLTNNLFVGGNNYNNSTTYSVSDYKFTSKAFEAGLGIHFQTSGKHAVTHFIGPYVGMAQFNGTYNEVTNYYNPNGYYAPSSTVNRSFTMNRLYVMLDNGFLFRATKSFNIILMAGLGYHIDTYSSNDPTKATNFNTSQLPVNAFKLGLSFGYRF